jgi:transcriptional regulator
MIETRRQQIIDILEDRAITIQDLATTLRADIKDIIDDLEHIKLSIKSKKLKVEPAFCKYCGFVFKEREKLKTPTKCPKCRKEWIQPALFRIE